MCAYKEKYTRTQLIVQHLLTSYPGNRISTLQRIAETKPSKFPFAKHEPSLLCRDLSDLNVACHLCSPRAEKKISPHNCVARTGSPELCKIYVRLLVLVCHSVMSGCVWEGTPCSVEASWGIKWDGICIRASPELISFVPEIWLQLAVWLPALVNRNP